MKYYKITEIVVKTGVRVRKEQSAMDLSLALMLLFVE